MTTFSQLVDLIVAETKRPDMVTDFATFLNQSIRELHFEPSRGNAVFYEDNYIETQVRVDTHDEVFSWPIPNPEIFQNVAAVRFDNVYSNQYDINSRSYRPVYALRLSPTSRMDDELYVYQRARNQLLFRGFGGFNSAISIAYFEFPRSLKYHPSGSRQAIFDFETGWTYAAGITTPEQQQAAQDSVTNWLIMRWHTVLEEALRAKVYKRLSDETRSRQSYSLYTQLRQGLFTSEVADLGGPY